MVLYNMKTKEMQALMDRSPVGRTSASSTCTPWQPLTG